ncbi:MAG: serine/threonine-protein kinase, partial [Myxococcota bacterium]
MLTPEARFCGACGKAQQPTEPQSGRHAAVHGASSEHGDEMIGRVVAERYRLIAKLGEGGMGTVFRAEQISLKRTVALKLLRPDLSRDSAQVRRFDAEAKLVAQLSHPNTVTLYDFGQDSDSSGYNMLFIAMEYIEGQSLRQIIHREGAMRPGRALAIAEQVAASLADAHDHSIIHRDLKPDNVMLSVRGKRSDVVTVLDFGIAKLRDAQNHLTGMPVTQAGALLGTPQYMAPEQIRSEPVDGRTDVYAMGAMLYEMLTGRLPFEAPSLMAILTLHLHEMPAPPTQRRPDLGLPPELDRLVMTALNKQPEARPPSMEHYGEMIASCRASLAAAG